MGCDSQFDGLYDRVPDSKSTLRTPEERALSHEVAKRASRSHGYGILPSDRDRADEYVRVLTALIDSRIKSQGWDLISEPFESAKGHTDNIDRMNDGG